MSTQELPDPIAERVQQFTQTRDATPEEVANAILQRYDALSDALDDRQRWNVAYSQGRKKVVDDSSRGSSNGGGSSGEPASIITIGHGRVSRWVDKRHDDYQEGMSKDAAPRKDVLIANAIVTREKTGETNIASLTLDSTDGVDLGAAMDAFEQPFNVLAGNFNFSEPQTADSGYVLFSTDGTSLEAVEDPISMDERKKWVDKYVDDVTIADLDKESYRSHLSLTDGRGPADFGLDIKRVSVATIYDYWIDDDNPRGVYTILDNSILEPEELTGTKLHGENQRTAGLSAWSHSNLMEFDEGSVCDFYGTIQEDQNGQITMEIRGIDPIDGKPLDGDGDVDLGSHSSESF